MAMSAARTSVARASNLFVPIRFCLTSSGQDFKFKPSKDVKIQWQGACKFMRAKSGIKHWIGRGERISRPCTLFCPPSQPYRVISYEAPNCSYTGLNVAQKTLLINAGRLGKGFYVWGSTQDACLSDVPCDYFICVRVSSLGKPALHSFHAKRRDVNCNKPVTCNLFCWKHSST